MWPVSQQWRQWIWPHLQAPAKHELLFNQGILKGKYHCTIGLLFDWFGISCMTTDNFGFHFAKHTNPNQSNRRSTVQWYFPPLVFHGSTNRPLYTQIVQLTCAEYKHYSLFVRSVSDGENKVLWHWHLIMSPELCIQYYKTFRTIIYTSSLTNKQKQGVESTASL